MVSKINVYTTPPTDVNSSAPAPLDAFFTKHKLQERVDKVDKELTKIRKTWNDCFHLLVEATKTVLQHILWYKKNPLRHLDYYHINSSAAVNLTFYSRENCTPTYIQPRRFHLQNMGFASYVYIKLGVLIYTMREYNTSFVFKCWI